MSSAPITSPSPTFWQMLGRALTAPDRLFEAIRTTPSRLWIWVALLFLLAALLPAVVAARSAAEAMTAAQTAIIEADDRSVTAVPPGEPGEVVQTGLAFVQVFAFIGPIIALGANWLAWAGFLLMIASIMGGQSHFGQLWRLAVWSYLPLAIKAVLSGVYGLLISPGQMIDFSLAALLNNPFPEFDPTLPPEEAMAAFTPPDPGQIALFELAGWFDIFIVWRLLLLILGFAIIARLSLKKSAVAVIGLWLLVVAAAVIPSFFVGGLF